MRLCWLWRRPRLPLPCAPFLHNVQPRASRPSLVSTRLSMTQCAMACLWKLTAQVLGNLCDLHVWW